MKPFFMNKLIFFLVLFSVSIQTASAQQEENFGYLFNESLGNYGSLYVHLPTNDETPRLKAVVNRSAPLCNITKRNKDTLEIIFWDIVSKRDLVHYQIDSSAYSSIYNGSTCSFVIKKWDKIKAFNYFKLYSYKREGIKFPYRYFGFSALQLPFRIIYGETDERLQSEFLNLNLAGLWHYGKVTIFKNPNIPVSTREFGVGPFLGLRAIEGSTERRNAFGVNIGLCITYSFHKLQLILGQGLELDFSKKNHYGSIYTSFGIGYEIFSQFEPEISQD